MSDAPSLPSGAKRSSRWPLLLLALTAVCLALAVYRLIQLRFSSGDNYPHYSSFRTDPLGVKILHDSLEESAPGRVSRNFRPLSKLQGGRPKVLFWLGEPDFEELILPEEARQLFRWTEKGNTFVMALKPKENSSSTARPGSSRPFRPVPLKMQTNRVAETVLQSLGVTLTNLTADRRVLETRAAREGAFPLFPSSISWIGSFGLISHTSAWDTVYSSSGIPVTLHRKIGQGDFYLFSSSYLFSNEALRKDKDADFLAALIPANADIVFDETHLGSASQVGVSDLIHKYRLQPVAGALFLLAALFIWRNASPLLPWQNSGETAALASSGMTTLARLLRRSLPPAELLRTCMVEWKTHSLRRAPGLSEKVERAAQAYQSAGADKNEKVSPVSAYNQIVKAINQRKL